jgi:U3 small nucleolar RNA-associated protein 21
LGFENGAIIKFNLQSGIVREESKDIHFHDGPVTGIRTDPLNKLVITTGMDGKVKIWDFFRLGLMRTIEIDDSAALYNLTMDSVNLFAFTTSSLNLFVYDALTLKCIRRFDNIATNAITSVCFSFDSKWVITASMDKSLKVWDLLTASLVDWVQFCNIPMSVAFSPTGEYLATTHVDKKGNPIN